MVTNRQGWRLVATDGTRAGVAGRGGGGCASIPITTSSARLPALPFPPTLQPGTYCHDVCARPTARDDPSAFRRRPEGGAFLFRDIKAPPSGRRRNEEVVQPAGAARRTALHTHPGPPPPRGRKRAITIAPAYRRTSAAPRT